MGAKKRVGAPKEALTRVREEPSTKAETAERVDRIVEIMRRDAWVRGETGPLLAEEWGLSEATVKKMAAEASRAVARAIADPDKLKADVAAVLVANLYRASDAREFGDVAKLGDVVTKIVGARAPERHEHAVVVAQYDALPRVGKVAWLRERASRFLAEAKRLEADAGGE